MTTLAALALAAAVKDEAGRLGFDAVAIGPATPPPHADAFERWLDGGRAGSMDYLQRTRAERLDPARLLPGARAVVALAASYRRPEDPPADSMRVARYAGRADYHDVLRPRLTALARFIDSATGGARSRAAIDTSAVLERDLAARAGLGWIGKNTNLLSPSLGSWFFIGIVLTTAELPHDAERPDRCGTCTACLDACPTGAFEGPYVLDARRCISYLTIEHQGEIDEALRPLMGGWGFGCDVCQDVCPWNRRAATTREPAFSWTTLEPEALLGLDETAFRARFRHTSFWRARRSGLLRNAAIVLGNRRDDAAVGALHGALADHDPTVSDAAGWALSRLGGTPLAPSSAVPTSQEGASLTMDQKKRDQQQPQRDARQMDQERNRDMSKDRNEAETGKPVQLDKDKPEHQGGQHHEGGGQQGGRPQHQPGQPQHQPGGERKPDQGQHTQR